MVAKGDNTRVKCSYSRSECKLDKNVHRISNGFFNYVGKLDPSLWGQVPVLVMCHTRELAFQISKEDERFSKFLPAIKVGVFFFLTDLPLPRMNKSLEQDKMKDEIPM